MQLQKNYLKTLRLQNMFCVLINMIDFCGFRISIKCNQLLLIKSGTTKACRRAKRIMYEG